MTSMCVGGGPPASDVIPLYLKVTSMCVYGGPPASDVTPPLPESDEYVCVLVVDLQSDVMPSPLK